MPHTRMSHRSCYGPVSHGFLHCLCEKTPLRPYYCGPMLRRLAPSRCCCYNMLPFSRHHVQPPHYTYSALSLCNAYLLHGTTSHLSTIRALCVVVLGEASLSGVMSHIRTLHILPVIIQHQDIITTFCLWSCLSRSDPAGR